MTRPSGPKHNRSTGTIPIELNRRYEARVARQTVLTELAWAAMKIHSKETAGLMALQVIKNLDNEDEWWAERDRWLMQEWLDWATEEIAREELPDPFRQNNEPIVGFHNMYVKG